MSVKTTVEGIRNEVHSAYKSEETEDFLDKKFNNPLGFLRAKLFIKLGVSPNAITVPSMAIGVAGAGGLGSNLAMYLARMGVGRLLLVDFDTIELSNLNRQHYFLPDVGRPKVEALREHLLAVNPYLEVSTTVQRVTAANVPELFGKADIICEAF
ncbi:MAG: ThiF family adenylyltransferase, partial [Clostridia bacterium]|nr:ThiF family adenylyltransferase [Clostridia bacterium]